MARTICLAAAFGIMAWPASADWVFLGGPPDGDDFDICLLGYETDTTGFMIWSDEKSVAAILADSTWQLGDGFEGWAGVQFGAGDNTAFSVQKSDEFTVLAPLADDQWLHIIGQLFQNVPGTVVTHDAQVWTLPAGASDVVAQWTACIVPGVS